MTQSPLLNPEEQLLLEHSRDLADGFSNLEVIHPDDQADVYFHIRAIQTIILARPGMRTMSEPYLHVTKPAGDWVWVPTKEETT